MLLAAIETSGPICGVALFEDARMLYAASLSGDRVHDRWCARMVEIALEATGLAPESLGQVAVSVGPGSFTGLRIGIGVAIGLAIGAGARMIPVPTLDASAYAALEPARSSRRSRVLALAPAGRGQMYTALYDVQNDFRRLTEYRLIEQSMLAELIDETTAVVGAGADLVEGAQRENVLSGSTQLDPAAVGRLALRLHYRGVGVGPEGIEPLYIREFTPKISARAV